MSLRLLMLGCVFTICCSLAATLCAADPTPKNSAEAPKVNPDEVARLVRELGDDDFQTREKASEELTRIGFNAEGALKDAAKNTDREIRYRAQRILTSIEKLEFEKRLERFLSSKSDGSELSLPSWDRFRKAYGDARATKLLFVDMVKAEKELLVALEKNPKTSGDMYVNRMLVLQQAQQFMPAETHLGSISTMLFVAADPEVPMQAQATNMIYSLCHQNAFRQAVTAGDNKELLRNMLGGWIRRVDDMNAYMPMMLAMQYDVKEALVPAERIVKAPNMASHSRQYALLVIGKYGTEEHVKMLTPLMNDKTVCNTWTMNNGKGQIQIQSQIRDVALAIALHLLKKDPKQFGFDHLQPTQPFLFAAHTMGFENDTKRTASMKKWEDFQAEQKKNAGGKEAKPADAKPADNNSADAKSPEVKPAAAPPATPAKPAN